MGSGLGLVDGDVDSDGETVGDADGSGVAFSDEQAASIRPEAIRTMTQARSIHIVFPIKKGNTYVPLLTRTVGAKPRSDARTVFGGGLTG